MSKRFSILSIFAAIALCLMVAVPAIGISLMLGIFFGLIAGYAPKWLDNILLLLFDAIRSFPTVMLALALATIIGPSLYTVVLVVILFSAPAYARIIRTQTLALRNAEFVLASVVTGASVWRVLGVHILPNILGPILILVSMDLPVVIEIVSAGGEVLQRIEGKSTAGIHYVNWNMRRAAPGSR